MLQITIPASEFFDETTNSFIKTKEQTLQLEHSLISIHKWEAKWRVPFLRKEPMTIEQSLDYVRCMTLNQHVDDVCYNVLQSLHPDLMTKIYEYINEPMTATWFSDKEKKKSSSRRAITAELVYYWMIQFNIPYECRKWHFNSLMTLIHICDVEQAPKKKMKQKDWLKHQRSLNAARRAASGSLG